MNSSQGVFGLRFVLCSTKTLDYLDWVLRQKGFGAGYDMVTVIIGNYVWP